MISNRRKPFYWCWLTLDECSFPLTWPRSSTPSWASTTPGYLTGSSFKFFPNLSKGKVPVRLCLCVSQQLSNVIYLKSFREEDEVTYGSEERKRCDGNPLQLLPGEWYQESPYLLHICPPTHRLTTYLDLPSLDKRLDLFSHGERNHGPWQSEAVLNCSFFTSGDVSAAIDRGEYTDSAFHSYYQKVILHSGESVTRGSRWTPINISCKQNILSR